MVLFERNKEQEVHYTDNVINGPLIRWYVNGNYESKSYYKDGKLEGKALMYDEDGNLLSEENYINDTLVGKFTQWYPSGQIKISGSYIHGNYSGTWLYYDLKGEIVGTGNYVNGSGIQKAWHPNGNIMREINYVNNLKHGEEKFILLMEKLKKSIIIKKVLLIINVDLQFMWHILVQN